MKEIIIIEGLDGCGKNTVTMGLTEMIQKEKKVLHISAPNYELYTGEFIADVLHGRRCTGDNPYIISLPYSINRLENYKNHEAAINDADVIVIDRSWMSNVMYQTTTMSLPEKINYLSWLASVEIKDTFLDKPDVNIHIFHLRHEDFDQGRALLKKRQLLTGDVTDKYENDTEYQRKVLASSDITNYDLSRSNIDYFKDLPIPNMKNYYIMTNIFASTKMKGMKSPSEIVTEIYNQVFSS